MHDSLGKALLTDSHRFERRAMGSPLRLSLAGVREERAAEGWAVVSAAIEEIEQALSRFRPTSDLVALNDRSGDAIPRPVHRRLYAAVVAAERARRVTGGAFDARVLGDLERLGYRGAAGRSEPVDGARDGTAFDNGTWLVREPRRRALAVAAPIDLGGIGKGLALRWAFASLAAALPELEDGSTGALLEAGGDIVACGVAPGESPWLVAIDHPATGEEIAVVTMPGGAICTSSIGVHAWRAADGREVHHLIDPATGEPGGDGLLAVTVAATDPAWAEVRSKTLFLEGARGIGPRARALGLAAWWVRADGAVEMTPAARIRTAWLAADAEA
jgi:FAD:protein FMN transferase